MAELFDAAVGLFPADDREAARESLEVTHPRHPFDERCLVSDRLGIAAPWSFAARDLVGAERRRNRPHLREPVPRRYRSTARTDEVVELDDLRTFLRDPVATFVRRSLEADLPRPSDEVDDILPVDPDGLAIYRIGQDLLDARLQGTDDADWRRAERAKGDAASRRPGGPAVRRPLERGRRPARRGRGPRRSGPEPRSCATSTSPWPDGVRIVGTIPLGLDGPSPGTGRVQFTRPKETQRLEAWLDLMVLVASEPTVPWRSVVVTRAERKGKDLTPVVARAGGQRRCRRHGRRRVGTGRRPLSPRAARAAPAVQLVLARRARPRRRATGHGGPAMDEGTGRARRSDWSSATWTWTRSTSWLPVSGDPGVSGQSGRALRPPSVGCRRPDQQAAGRDGGRSPLRAVRGPPDRTGGHRSQRRDGEDVHLGGPGHPVPGRAWRGPVRTAHRHLHESGDRRTEVPHPWPDGGVGRGARRNVHRLRERRPLGSPGQARPRRAPAPTRAGGQRIRRCRHLDHAQLRRPGPQHARHLVGHRPRCPSRPGRGDIGPPRLRGRIGDVRPAGTSTWTSCRHCPSWCRRPSGSSGIPAWTSNRRRVSRGRPPNRSDCASWSSPRVANLQGRRQDSGTMGYDDVLGQLRAALVDRSSAAVIEALRSRVLRRPDRRVPGHRPRPVGDLLDPLRQRCTRWHAGPRR